MGFLVLLHCVLHCSFTAKHGAVIGFTGPALPSLLNITGDPGDGTDIWTETIVINAQEASWISESGWSMRDEVLNCVYLQRECCKLAVSWVVSSLGL